MIAEAKQQIHQPIRVLASFGDNKIRVHFFNWNERIYKVQSMNMFHIAKDGTKKIYHFAVSAEGNAYELTYDPVALDWYLEEIIEN